MIKLIICWVILLVSFTIILDACQMYTKLNVSNHTLDSINAANAEKERDNARIGIQAK